MAKSTTAYTLIPLVTIFALQGALATNLTSTANPAITNYARPISFEPNRGQTDQQVDFLAHGAGYRLFLSHAEAVIVLQPGGVKPGSRLAGATVGLRPVGTNPSTPPKALDQQSSKSNYFIGNVPERWHTGIPNYAKVRYRNVYPGIDMIYYGNQRQLEYDFVVDPGANPGRIGLQLDGSSKAALDRSGDLVMHTAAGDMHWHKPIAYQESGATRKLIECAYVRKAAHLIAFKIAAYDRTKPLIIDPVLVYSTYLGGSASDLGSGIAVDAHGYAYVTLQASSNDIPLTNPLQDALAGAIDVFIAKFDPLGNLVYSTYLGGKGSDIATGIAVDARRNAYVTGHTTSSDFPTKNPFQATLRNSSGNAFVTKLNAAGNGLVYSTYLGGSEPALIDSQALDFGDQAAGIAVDAYGYAYIAGTSGTTDFPTKNAFQSSHAGGNLDAFVTKLCPAGNALVYSTYLGGNNDDYGGGIALDRHRNAYVTGATVSHDFPTKNAFQEMRNSITFSGFVTKLGPAGNALVYSTYLGGSGRNTASGVAVDLQGHAYITGTTTSTDFPTKNAFQKMLRSRNGNAFVTKLCPLGNALVYSTYLGGSGDAKHKLGDQASGITVDWLGQAYVTGQTTSTDFPTKHAFQTMLGGVFGDAFVTKLCPAGNGLVYSSYLGGDTDDTGFGIAVDAEGHAYITGITASFDFPTKNAFQSIPGGSLAGANAFVTKISAH